MTIEKGWPDIISIYALPPSLRKELRTSNRIERPNGEIKRRESVIRISPNEASILRLMGAVLMDENEKWSQRKYMDLSALKWWNENLAIAPMGADEGREERVA